MSIASIWDEMEAQPAGASTPITLARRIYRESGIDLFVAYRIGTGSRVLMLKCSNPSGYQLDDLPASRGFTVRFIHFPDDQSDVMSVEVESAGLPFREVFTVLAEDVASHLAMHATPGTELDVLKTRLGRWQNFFEQHGPEGLSEEAQRGLFGELWCVRYLLLPHMHSQVQAVDGWTGPTAAAKDFELPGCAIEVKSCLGKQHHRVMIANERQLDDAGFVNFFLLCLLMERVVSAGETLPSMVTAIYVMLQNAPMALAAYEEKLIRAGYLDVHQQMYAKTHYAVHDHQIFRVKNGFPRITGNDIQPGVGDVRYSVVLSACSGFRVPDSEIIGILTVISQ